MTSSSDSSRPPKKKKKGGIFGNVKRTKALVEEQMPVVKHSVTLTCPSCGSPQEDTSELICPYCDVPLVEQKGEGRDDG